MTLPRPCNQEESKCVHKSNGSLEYITKHGSLKYITVAVMTLTILTRLTSPKKRSRRLERRPLHRHHPRRRHSWQAYRAPGDTTCARASRFRSSLARLTSSSSRRRSARGGRRSDRRWLWGHFCLLLLCASFDRVRSSVCQDFSGSCSVGETICRPQNLSELQFPCKRSKYVDMNSHWLQLPLLQRDTI